MESVIPELRPSPARRPKRMAAHDVTLRGADVTLRPMGEDDWDVLLAWNNDPVVMALADHNPFQESSLADLQTIYRWLATHAYCFIMVVDDAPIGECWLQQMNLQRLVDRFPDLDLRRIDLMIGEKDQWGRGYGTEAIRLLVEFGFGDQRADGIFAPVMADNRRSQRAFQKNGFTRYSSHREPDGRVNTDLVVWRTEFEAAGAGQGA